MYDNYVWGGQILTQSLDPVDLPFMLLCWLRTQRPSHKWATDVGPWPWEMIERGGQRKGKRESHKPGWVADKSAQTAQCDSFHVFTFTD